VAHELVLVLGTGAVGPWGYAHELMVEVHKVAKTDGLEVHEVAETGGMEVHKVAETAGVEDRKVAKTGGYIAGSYLAGIWTSNCRNSLPVAVLLQIDAASSCVVRLFGLLRQ